MHSSGKIWIEQKDEMRARGAKSPDIGDAFCLAFGVQTFGTRLTTAIQIIDELRTILASEEATEE